MCTYTIVFDHHIVKKNKMTINKNKLMACEMTFFSIYFQSRSNSKHDKRKISIEYYREGGDEAWF